MTSERDDDALTWAGDDDNDAAAPGRPHPTAVPVTTATDQPSPATLVGMGVLGGIYLLYTVGWFIGVSRIDNPIAEPVGQFMFSLGAWLAVAAPTVWFGTTFWLTAARPRVRLLWLLAGVLLLAPLPAVIASGTLS